MKILKIILVSIICTLLFSSCKYKLYPIDLGGNYFLGYNPNSEISIFIPYETYELNVVESTIVNYAFDSMYIVAKQKPRPECSFESDYKSCKKAFKESTFVQYWIINKDTGEKLGPFSLETYRLKLDELGVTNNEFLNLWERN